MPDTYATTSDYRDYIDGGPVPAELTRAMLRDASRRVDRAMKGAIYDTDPRGNPIDCDIAEAFRDAVCAQVQDWIETGDYGSGGVAYSDVQIGSVRVSRNAARPGAQPTGVDLCQKGLDALAGADLWPVDPLVRG